MSLNSANKKRELEIKCLEYKEMAVPLRDLIGLIDAMEVMLSYTDLRKNTSSIESLGDRIRHKTVIAYQNLALHVPEKESLYWPE